MEKEKEKTIHSWVLAKYETGKETDVVMREAMWYDFVNGSDFTQSETAIQREEFFSYLGRCVSEHNFKGLKTVRSKGKKIGYRCLREKQVQTSLDMVLKGHEVEDGEGSRLGDKTNEEGKISEKHRKESSIFAPEVTPEKTDLAFCGKGFQESIEKNKTVKSSVKRRHSEDEGHKTDGDTKEADDDIKDGVNQSKQDSSVDQEKGKEDVKKKSNTEPISSSSSFIHNISTKVAGIHQSHTAKTVGDAGDAKETFHGNCSPDTTCYTKGQDEQAMGTSEAAYPSNSSFDGDMSIENDTSNSPGICRQRFEEEQVAPSVRDVRDISNNEAEWGEEIYDQGFSSRGSSSGEECDETSDETSKPKKENWRRSKTIKKHHRISSSSSCSPERSGRRQSNDGLKSSPRRKNPASPKYHKRQRSEKQKSRYSEDEGDSPERFFKRHHKKMKSLLPKHLPGSPKSFHDYLSRVLKVPNSHNERRIDVYSHSGDTVKRDSARYRSFVATAFPPIKVGQVAGAEVAHTFPGDMFPQFTHHQKSLYHCELCVPYQRWAKKEGLKHAALKSKSVSIDDIMRGTAVLHFSGVVQAREHFISKAHQEAIDFFKSEATEKVTKVNNSKPASQKSTITNFFAPKIPLN